ncbi:MAG TPA: protein kinase [Thermoanaerobaculia bacterium]|jgi:serine/threonine-protein kinase|nr:protein kinase [Thermoanaerobaculia bacterium]
MERIGPYRLIRRLGMGGMGEVFLAYDDRLERPVAIKQIRREAAGDPGLRERLLREARAAARLSHPNIVQVYDILEAAGGDSIVMEYVAGRSVAEMLEPGPLPLALTVELARQIAAGLAAAHAAGLVHRDLKSENVLVDGEGRARILDFGLAKPLDSNDQTLTEHGAVLGTYRAMSPEQSRGEPADARSDLFSFGVLLYEALTGISPFAGRTPIETLRRIDEAAPQPVTVLRPEVPPELATLVHALLEKDPRHRPVDAAQVARELQTLASLPSLPELAESEEMRPATSLSRSLSASVLADTPTILPLSKRPPNRRSGFGSDADIEPTSPTGRIVRPQARRLAMALLLLLALAAAGAVLVERSPLFHRRPLRVAVLRPIVADIAGGPDLDLAASGTLVAELRGLLALDGLTPVDPSQIGDVKGTPQDAARAAAADEVLTARIEGSRRTGFLSLQRLRAQDGATLWSERIAIPLPPDAALVLANAVGALLRRAYPGHDVRRGTPDLEVRAEDYAAYVAVKQRLDAGRTPRAPELGRLETVLAGSPRFLDGQLEAASLAATLYQDTKRSENLTRAQAFLEKARALAPGYPPLLSVEIGLATAEGDWRRADAALRDLAALVPGDPIVLVQRCRILQARGDVNGAVELLRQLAADRPTFPNLLWLAALELRLGQVGAARRHLEQSLELAPGNTWPLAKLAELELLYGDLRRAERIYLGLIAATPHRSNLTNLGIVRYLLGDYAGAIDSYHRALAMEPGHLTVTLNLADAELALGRRQEAMRHYAEVLAAVEKKASTLPLEPGERTIEAQCLAHLGRGHEAVALVLDTLAAHPNEPELTYQAALVFALSGENGSALAFARKAVGLGVQPRWLNTPGFESLRTDPTFRALLASPPSR